MDFRSAGERRSVAATSLANKRQILCPEVPRPRAAVYERMLRSGLKTEQGVLFSPVDGQNCFEQQGAIDRFRLRANHNRFNDPGAEPAYAQ